MLSVAHVQTLEEGTHANRMSLGNMAVIFTRDGRAAREFRGQCGRQGWSV